METYVDTADLFIELTVPEMELMGKVLGTNYITEYGMILPENRVEWLFRYRKDPAIRDIIKERKIFHNFRRIDILLDEYYSGDLLEELEGLVDPEVLEIAEWLFKGNGHDAEHWEIYDNFVNDETLLDKVLKEVEEMEIFTSMALELIDYNTL